jgi:hypothetical protein
VKRIAICVALILGLIIPITSTASATEKCLASIPDSEWSRGYPAVVRSLLGFDLVEMISKSPNILPREIIHPFYLLGDHTETYTYNYVGKNCLSRDVVVSKVINQQSVTFSHQNLNEFASKLSRDFLQQEKSLTHYAEIRNEFEMKTIKIVRQNNIKRNYQEALFPISEVLSTRTSYQRDSVPLLGAFIYFPTKCGYFKRLDDKGFEVNEKIYASLVSGPQAQGLTFFDTTGICVGELRQGGLFYYLDRHLPSGQGSIAEKIADIRYVVTDPAAPVAITCKKGNLTKKVKGENSKCPKGFKKV